MANTVIVELVRNNKNYASVVEDIVKIEKKLFPKHESVATVFDEELKKKNCGLLYSHVNGEVSGYVMYQCFYQFYCSLGLKYFGVQKCRTRHIQRVQLHVDPSRTAALALYQKLGFK
ncbi:hypothetical protein MKX01_020442 [Papaver californicum]|nr:hypothetical protein MKX01_020442 [Papaver californicum]